MHPLLLDLYGFTIYSYGAALVLAAAVSGLWSWHARPAGLFSGEQFLGLAIVTVLGASIGARLAHAALHGTLGAASIAASWRAWQGGGLASAGVPVALLPLIAGYCAWQRLSLLRVLDHLLPFAVLGAAILRTGGCFLAGCCAGRPTAVPWALRFPGSDAAVHPTQLYLGLALALAFVLLRRVRHRRPGFTAALGLLLYGGIQVAAAPFRADLPALSVALAPHLHLDLGHALLALAAAGGLLAWSWAGDRRAPAR